MSFASALDRLSDKLLKFGIEQRITAHPTEHKRTLAGVEVYSLALAF
ncbi:hypothetical protein JOH51_006891 [Rhizobium leguminosarum]|nr:hypothetical protein [Rhizobium leguminosarum]MBP2449383.1 hypothetical protein [Rhizobium leguminosarum]